MQRTRNITFGKLSGSDGKTSLKKKNNIKEKSKRRTLRSKIAKILQNLPITCEKRLQQEYCSKWAKKKKKFYEVNENLEKQGLEPISKLNISTDSECSENNYYSARMALINSLSEDELALLSEDPVYFMHDKRLLKAEIENNWDDLLKNDPKDPENIKKGVKSTTQIDFLKELNRNKSKSSKKQKKFWRSQEVSQVKFEIKTGSSIFDREKKYKAIAKPVQSELLLKQNKIKTSPTLKTLAKLPKLEKQSKISTLRTVSIFPVKKANKEMILLLNTEKQIQNIIKEEIRKSAKEFKVSWVKNYLQKWESRRKTAA